MSQQPQGVGLLFWPSFKLYNNQKSHVYLFWSPHAQGPQSLHCVQAHDTSAFAVREGRFWRGSAWTSWPCRLCEVLHVQNSKYLRMRLILNQIEKNLAPKLTGISEIEPSSLTECNYSFTQVCEKYQTNTPFSLFALWSGLEIHPVPPLPLSKCHCADWLWLCSLNDQRHPLRVLGGSQMPC